MYGIQVHTPIAVSGSSIDVARVVRFGDGHLYEPLVIGLERVHQHGGVLIAPHPVRACALGAHVAIVADAQPIRLALVIAIAVQRRHFVRTFGDDVPVVLVAHGRAHLRALSIKLHFGHRVRVHEEDRRAQVEHGRRRESGTCGSAHRGVNALL